MVFHRFLWCCFFQAAVCRTTAQKAIFPDNAKSVSYTHLDVYKRQPLGYSPDRYHIRPWFPEDDAPYEPDYTLYRKGWEIGEGVHIATGNYTKSFTDLSIESPGVTSDFVRTYNSISTEESSFGIGWDFNIDVSKIVKPTAGYYQVCLLYTSPLEKHGMNVENV